MAHLWIEDIPGEWAIMPLAQSRVAMGARRLATSSGAAVQGSTVAPPAFVLVRGSASHPADWHLVGAPGADILINGLPMLARLSVLVDRDEIGVAGGDTWYFSSEELPRVTVMPVTAEAMSCPRCRQRVEPESPAVRCPQCGIWHHASADLPCWEYGPNCAMCPQSTAPDAGFRWTPMEL